MILEACVQIHLQQVLAVWPWGNRLTSLSFCFLICKKSFTICTLPNGHENFCLASSTQKGKDLKRLSQDAQFSRSVMSDYLRPHGLQHARPPCPSPTPRVYSNSCPLSWWCHPNISSSVVPFSSCLQSFPPSGSFQVSQFFASGGQSIGVSKFRHQSFQ